VKNFVVGEAVEVEEPFLGVVVPLLGLQVHPVVGQCGVLAAVARLGLRGRGGRQFFLCLGFELDLQFESSREGYSSKKYLSQ
jgi:hypothetical protein